jgi:hypothetical protein
MLSFSGGAKSKDDQRTRRSTIAGKFRVSLQPSQLAAAMMRQDVVSDCKKPRGLAASFCVVAENVRDGFLECVGREIPRDLHADAPGKESEHGVELRFDKASQASLGIARSEPAIVTHS